jgi:uncharacterized protein with PQ loop repeat
VSLLEAAGYLATVLTVFQLLPQVRRTLRTGDVAGVSPLYWAIQLVAATSWITIGVREVLVPTVAVNVFAVGCTVTMLWALWTHRASGSDTAARVVAIGLPTVALLGLFAPTAVLAVFAGVVTMAMFWPQVLAALRGDDLSGLSLSSWVLSTVVATLWIVFGADKGLMLWLTPLHGAVLSAVVVARILVTRRDPAPAELVALESTALESTAP